jgi:DNA-binding LytR/AlgR family response regulator
MTSTYTCIIIDDEPLAIRLLEKHVVLIPQLKCIGSYSSAVESMNILSEKKVDLIFLDIEMPQLDGLSYASTISGHSSIIFTTAYREYAAESYEIEAIDYLLKPITFPRFLKAVNKFLGRQESKPVIVEDEKDFIFVSSNKNNVKVILDDILYIESIGDYIKIYNTEDSVVSKYTITDFLELLPTHFLRIHRSYIVNSQHIKAFNKNEIHLPIKSLPIGISYKSEVNRYLHHLSK